MCQISYQDACQDTLDQTVVILVFTLPTVWTVNLYATAIPRFVIMSQDAELQPQVNIFWFFDKLPKIYIRFDIHKNA